MKITSKQLRIKAQEYIIDCIDSQAYDVETTTDREKLEFLYKTFLTEHGWENDRIGELNSFRNWIQGLPTVFGIEFSNYDILNLAKSWGSLPQDATESQEDRILENYWNFITNHTFQLFRKHKII